MPTEISGSTGVNKIQDGTVVAGDLASSVALGKVLQVVQVTKTSETLSSSTSFVSAGLSASITPSATSSKVLVAYHIPSFINTASQYLWFTIFRGTVSGTNLGHSLYGFSNLYSGGGILISDSSGKFLDSPSTTSAQTYTIGMKVNGGQGTSSVNGSTSTITLMEISG